MLPGFQPQWTAREGAQELYDAYRIAGLTFEDLEGGRYVRISHIQRQLKGGDWTILSAGQIVEVFSPQVSATGPAPRRAAGSSALTNVSKSFIYYHLRVLIRWHSPVFRRQPNCDTVQPREGLPGSLMAVALLETENPSQDEASIFGRYLSFFYIQEAAGAANPAGHNDTYMVTMTLPSDVEARNITKPCRFCGVQLVRTFVDLGMSPLCETSPSVAAANPVAKQQQGVQN